MVLLASDFDKSKYLKATDLDREQKFRIKIATDETVGVGDKKERKLILWFTNDARGLVLNRINNRTLREAFGDLVEAWYGKVISVFPTVTDLRGKSVPALRVRIPPPKPATSTAPAAAPTATQAAAPAAAPAPIAAAAPPAAPVAAADPELADEPLKPLADELDDEIPF